MVKRDKDMQKNLALIAKYFKKIYKPTNNNLRTSSNSKNKNVDTTPRYKNDDHSRQFGNQRTVNVATARENVGSKVVQQSGIQFFNCKEYGHFAKECRKPKRVKDSAYHKEKMLLCKQAEQDVSVQVEQYDWLADTDEEVDEQKLEAHYSYMVKIQEVPTADSGTDSEPVEQNEQNDVESDDERVALANLITNLKLDVDENKKTQKQLKKANTTLAQELKECKAILAKTSKSLGESISVRDSCLVALQTKQAQFEIPCLYAFPYDQSTYANRLIPDGEETLALERESRSKLNKDSVRPYDYTKLNSLYEIFKPPTQEYETQLAYANEINRKYALDELQCMYLHKVKECDCLAQKLSTQTESVSKKVHTELLQYFAKVEKHSISLELALQKCKEQVKIDTVCNEKASNVFRKEREQYFKIQDLKTQLHDKNIAINSLERKYFPKTKSVPKANVSEGLSKPITAQTLPQIAKTTISNTNVLRPGMYRIDNRITHTRAPQLPQTVRNTNPRVSTFIGVNHKPNVSRPQLKSNQSKDKVLPNKSQVKVKKTQVEVHPRIPSVSNKIKSVTVCKDSLNFKTLNANAFCATCNKCLIDSNHFACVTKMLNDVHARTKKPTVVPISTRKPQSQANKSIVTPNKKKVASKSTDQKPQSYFRVLDSENLDKMKEKGDQCILAGYSTQSKGYRVYNKRTRMIVKSIHIRFDEIKQVLETSVANNTSGLVPQRQKASDYDNPDPIPQRQDVSSSADADIPSQQELDLLFGPLYDEFFNAEEGEQLQDDEFTNPFCASTQDVDESSSHNIGNSNVPTFNQQQVSEYRWTKDYPLEQVRGNPSRPVQTRRQLTTDPKMCMYALTVSTAEPKNIKEAMADST
nr:hypothetical protein [Tanacetum cinerariifolium]